MRYRAFWLTRVRYKPEEMEDFISSNETKGRRQIAAMMEQMADLGTNLLYLSARHSQGLVWHMSKVEPNPWGWDVLAAVTEEAHRHQIEIHPWMVMWGDRPSYHPEWHTTGRRMPYRGSYPWMCPARPEVRTYFQTMLLEWLDHYPVDGIHFDYIRYIDEPCYCDYHRSDFKARYGADPVDLDPGHPLYEAWLDYNVEHITSFVRWAAEEAHRRGKRISSAVFPLSGNTANTREIAHGFQWWCNVCRFGPEGSSDWCKTCTKDFALFQNWPDFVKAGYLDLVSPMNYVADNQIFRERLVRELQAVDNKVPVVEGIGVWRHNPENGGRWDGLVEQVEAARKAGAAGVCFFEWKEFMGAVPTDIRLEISRIWRL